MAEQEVHDNWIMGEVERGLPLPGLYLANAENKARYETWRYETWHYETWHYETWCSKTDAR